MARGERRPIRGGYIYDLRFVIGRSEEEYVQCGMITIVVSGPQESLVGVV